MNPIDPSAYRAVATIDPGPAPQLSWIKIADLVVDPTYQRAILLQGRRNVQRIADGFRWSFFSPVIVAPIEGGRYAIVDGQHRATAAALAGFDSVPCQIVLADGAEQARGFSAINGSTTKVSALAVFRAAIAAGEPEAVKINEACGVAEVELLPYPVPRSLQKPGQTMAVACVVQCFRKYGRETLITALMCITATSNNKPGILGVPTINGLTQVLHARLDGRDAGEALFEAFDRIDVEALLKEAATKAPLIKGSTATAVFCDLVTDRLGRALNQEVAS